MTRLKYVFFISSVILLVLMLSFSRKAAISCDEVLHYQQSVSVYNYFSTQGKDQSAINTPVTHLQYYGQMYDNFATLLIRWFRIEDVYTFRHILSALAGWLTVFVTALFAIWLSDTGTGIFVLFLFAVSPTFMGHAQNNLKDIPFALGYVSAIFFIIKLLFSKNGPRFTDIILLIISIGFSISIRAGGLLLIFYMIIIFFARLLNRYFKEERLFSDETRRTLILIFLVAFASYFLGILFWPYALQNPLINVAGSLRVMAHFPDTFRQIFESKTEWSDLMPWYYLPKSMAITVPIMVIAGFIIFFFFPKKISFAGKTPIYVIIIITVVFPISFAVINKSNLYSSWRQFLFVYPGFVLIAAIGFSFLYDKIRNRYLKWIFLVTLGFLAIHPVKFMSQNRRYSYLYYNQMVGGLRGALGNYETDYYFLGQTEASEWLKKFIKEKNDTGIIKVGATYSVEWQFRDQPDIRTFYLRNEERSFFDWDYAIVTNRYISPSRLKNREWPPADALHVVYADSVPICAILSRKSKTDFYGNEALNRGRLSEAEGFLKTALKENDHDEMIFFNFAAVLFKEGRIETADSVLTEGLKLNPDSEPVLMFLGNIAALRNRTGDAIDFYEKLIKVNQKYLEAYVKLSRLISDNDKVKARDLLRSCLRINSHYKPALTELANTYRLSDPEIARKYDELANKIE